MSKQKLNFEFTRRTYYLDHSVQGILIAAMITIQLLLAVAGIIIFYYGISDILEANMYSIHKVEMEQIYLQFVVLSAKVIGGYFIVNILAVAVANFIWIKYVIKVLAEFNCLVQKSANLDYSPDEIEPSHLTVASILKLRKYERDRWQSISNRIVDLQQSKDISTNSVQLLALLKELKLILSPKHSA